MAQILVVDDEPGIIQLLETVLQDAGHSVTGAASVDEALALLDKSAIDLVVLDLMLPDRSGWEFLDSLSRRGQDRRPPVAIVSAVFQEQAMRRALDDYKARGYLTKPFRIDELLAVIQDALYH